ncbi:MAG: hypothetical protein EB084_15510 [Proteobacteria bacterium]|nr:hypothetical protein [Pseudomonadota bacterium]
MLARIAENIYWLGRYVERVDDMLRLLEVQEETGGRSAASKGQAPAPAPRW